MRNESLVVGSIVRTKRGSKRSRAMVATVGGGTIVGPNTDDAVCILWEPIYPALISDRFRVTPKSIAKETEQDEVTVSVGMIEELLPFETDEVCPDDDKTNITSWKDKGDQLLRIGDPSAATSYYEKALANSSSISIGGNVILSVEGFPRIAEVDCVDDDEDNGGTLDVTLVHNGVEQTVKHSVVLLGILEMDADHLQERILLNLARCMLQLSDLDLSNRPKYQKSAVLATSLVLTLSTFWNEDQEGLSSILLANSQTALLLRCKAYIGLSKWKNAISDARQLVKKGSDQKQGNKLLATIERKKKLQSKTDKNLAKEICRLVQSVTEDTNNADSSSLSSVSRISQNPESTGPGERVRTTAKSDNEPRKPSEASHLPLEREESGSKSLLSVIISYLVHSGFTYYVLPLIAVVIVSKLREESRIDT